ncbi:uncharacterized protein [Parasteatoda tepidariorum]|uniref:uncharacterized protein n=1 Tax=Parasteatoda tepidariorum TaxID=114398 RepID=UPI0039BC419A
MENKAMDLSPPKKRQKKSYISKAEKEIILNIYKTEVHSKPDVPIIDVANHAASAAGVSTASVFRIIKEYKKDGILHSPKRTKPRKTFLDDIDDFDKNAVRRKVHDFFRRNEIPTINKVLKAVNDDSDLPNFKRTTFYSLLKKLGFKHQKRGRNSSLIEKEEIILWRRRYLRTINKMRQEGRKIYYMDETWLNAGHTQDKVWNDTSIISSKQAFLSGLSTGLKSPSGKGERLIITHIGSDAGFLKEGLLLFKSNKNKDYHKDMNAACFEEWFEKILPFLEPNSVVVMDNAPYHSRKEEKIPNTSSTKQVIKDWLKSKNIVSDEEGMLKTELLDIVKAHKHRYDKFAVDELARRNNIMILRLPPYHAELNPIELIWAQMKGSVAKENKTFKLSEVEELCMKSLNEIGVEKWKNCIEHIQKIEKEMWDLDEAIENTVNSLVININSNDEDSTSSESEF